MSIKVKEVKKKAGIIFGKFYSMYFSIFSVLVSKRSQL